MLLLFLQEPAFAKNHHHYHQGIIIRSMWNACDPRNSELTGV